VSRRLAVAIAIAATLGLGALLVAPHPAAGDAPLGRRASAPLAIPGPARPAAGAAQVCVAGAGAAAAAAAAHAGPALRDGRLDPHALAAVSRLAFAAERLAETTAAGPAWPQRMGLADGRPVRPPPTCVTVPIAP
jgi:hypothetical protein